MLGLVVWRVCRPQGRACRGVSTVVGNRTPKRSYLRTKSTRFAVHIIFCRTIVRLRMHTSKDRGGKKSWRLATTWPAEPSLKFPTAFQGAWQTTSTSLHASWEPESSDVVGASMRAEKISGCGVSCQPVLNVFDESGSAETCMSGATIHPTHVEDSLISLSRLATNFRNR